MNFKLAWVLLALLLLVIGGVLVSTLVDDTPPVGEVLLKPLATLTEDEIDTVEIVRSEPSEEKIVFTREGKDRWVITEPGRSQADSLAVKKIIDDLLPLKPTPSADVTSNKTVHGLNPPGIRVTLKSGEKSATLNVGDTTIGRDPITIVTTGTRPDVPVAVQRADLEAIFRPALGNEGQDGKSWQKAKWIGDYRQRAFFLGKSDLAIETESVTIAQGSKATKLVRNAGTGEWTFATPAGYGLADVAGDPQAKAGTFTGVRPLFTALTSLQVQGPADFIEKPEALSTYGLDESNKDRVLIEVKTGDGPAVTLAIGKRVDDKSDQYYCKLSSDSIVAKATMTPERVSAFAKVAADPSDLRDRTLIPGDKQYRIDAIDLTQAGATTKLRRIPTTADSRWVLYGGPGDPQAAGIAAQDLITALAKPRLATDILPAPYDAVFAEAERKVELQIWYDGTEKGAPVDPQKLPAEPKLASKPSLTLLFGKQEGDTVYVRRTTADGIRTDMKLPATILASIPKSRLAFLDPKLTTFPTNIVKKLTLVRGAETFTIESDGKAHSEQWKFLTPEKLKGNVADMGKVLELLNLVSTMNPVKVIAEKPDDAALAKMGLGTLAKLKLTVAFDSDKEPERTYTFGNATDDPSLIHLQVNFKPVITAIPKAIFDRFQNEDLRDRLICTIDEKKIKAVSLIGWKQALKKPTKYRFERTGDTWKLTEPADEKRSADPAKVEILLAALTAPRAVALIAGGFKPEMGFDLEKAENSLEVHMEMEDKSVISWHFARETDGGANYYGWTSARKDDVFTISAAVLKQFKEKPDSLLK